MAHLIELIVAISGLVAVLVGSLCVFRIGRHNECGPGLERASAALMVVGALAAAVALFAFSWLW